MIKLYNPNGFTNYGWKSLLLLAMMSVAFFSRAQEGSQGNATVFGSAQMSFFANLDFVAGGSGTLSGIILTERAANNFGVVNFLGDNLTTTGASDASYVDGYVRKYGAGRFIFPVGDNSNLGAFAASADGTLGAYFHADPSVAVTSNLIGGGDYPPLPSGGPFSTASKDAMVNAVSNIEYWDIDGANATPITLTWDAGSNISTLTGSDLTKLGIVGWDGSKWVKISATVDAVSILGGASTLTSGSVTSSSIIPNAYTAYTLASVIGAVPDLTAAQFFSNTQLLVGESVDYVVAVSNVGAFPTTSNFVFGVTSYLASSGLSITQNTAPAVTIDGDVFVLNNADFDVTTIPTRFTFTSKPGVVLLPLAVKYVGFKITRTGGGKGSTNNTVTINNGTGGGESPTNNNTIANTITKL